MATLLNCSYYKQQQKKKFVIIMNQKDPLTIYAIFKKWVLSTCIFYFLSIWVFRMYELSKLYMVFRAGVHCQIRY